MGTDLWRRSVLWLRESPKEYTPAAPLLITTLAHLPCQTVFGGRNPDEWTTVMRACFAEAINVVLVFETSRYAGAGWTIVAAGLECSFNYLHNAAFSSSLLTIRTNRRASRKPRMPFTTARKQSAAREMADTNPSTIRRVMEQLVLVSFASS
jgi:hypothetical protein